MKHPRYQWTRHSLMPLVLASSAILLSANAHEDRLSSDDFLVIPAAVYRAGSPEGGVNEQPRTCRTRSFTIAKYEVTAGEFLAFLDRSRPDETGELAARLRAGNSKLPAAGISFELAKSYCDWLGRNLGCAARLPSEDEWEYAAKGGIHGIRYPWGWGNPSGHASYGSNAPSLVGSYPANEFDLHDMAGNVYEWCEYSEKTTRSGENVARGGSWAEASETMLTTYRRTWFPEDYAGLDVGFRVVIEAEPHDSKSRDTEKNSP